MSYATRQAINWTEQGLVPDSVVRGAIRRLLRARLAELTGKLQRYRLREIGP